MRLKRVTYLAVLLGTLHPMFPVAAQVTDSVIVQAPLKRMGWREEREAKPIIVDNLKRSVLIVSSPIPDIDLESSAGVIREDRIADTIQVTLNPGKQTLRIAAPGYDTLKIENLTFKGGRGKTISIYHIPTDPNEWIWTSIDLWCLDPSCSELLAEVDGKIMRIPRRDGHLRLAPPVGLFDLTLRCADQVWTKRFNLLSGVIATDTVVFGPDTLARAVTAAEKENPGRLVIKSFPNESAGAIVYLNDIEFGRTPLEIPNVIPGEYDVRLVRDLYMADPRQVAVKAGETTPCDVTMTPNFGRIYIDSQPSGAQVTFLNLQTHAEQIMGRTPLQQTLSAGKYQVRLQREHYEPLLDTIAVLPNGDHSFDQHALKPQFAKVAIASLPPGAHITMDENQIGITPHIADTVGFGLHSMRLSLEEYIDTSFVFTVFDTSSLTFQLPLTHNVGWISIQSEPDSAEVVIRASGKLLGYTPLIDRKVTPGSYDLYLKQPLYDTAFVSITVGMDEHMPVKQVNLRRARGHLKVQVQPSGTRVWLDGKKIGESPLETDTVIAGLRNLELRQATYDPIQKSVEIAEAGVTLINDTLKRDNYLNWLRHRHVSRPLALLIPGGGQFASRQYLRGLFYFAWVGTAYHMAELSTRHARNADLRQDSWLAAVSTASSAEDSARYSAFAHSARSDAENYRDNSRLYTIAFCAGYLIQAADAIVFGGGKIPPGSAEEAVGQARFDFEAHPAALRVTMKF